MEQLVAKQTGRNEYETKRFIIKKFNESRLDPVQELQRINEEPVPEFDAEVLARLKAQFPGSPAQAYMHSRGFEDSTLDFFNVGYSVANDDRPYDAVTVPVYDHNDKPVGMVGRSLEGKQFKNSKKLPRNRVLYNLNNAKRYGDTLIVVESTFDVLACHQAGYPHTAAVLGGYLSPNHFDLIDRHFNKVVIFTDPGDTPERKMACRTHTNGCPDTCINTIKYCMKCKLPDCRGHKAGEELGFKIVAGLRHKYVLWACYDPGYGILVPEGCKDATDMVRQPKKIAQCIDNAITTLEYTDLQGEQQ